MFRSWKSLREADMVSKVFFHSRKNLERVLTYKLVFALVKFRPQPKQRRPRKRPRRRLRQRLKRRTTKRRLPRPRYAGRIFVAISQGFLCVSVTKLVLDFVLEGQNDIWYIVPGISMKYRTWMCRTYQYQTHLALHRLVHLTSVFLFLILECFDVSTIEIVSV